MEDILNRAERRVIISCFSSSVHRLQQIIDLAAEFGRKVAFLGRSMLSTTEIAHAHGLLHIPNGLLVRPQDIMDVAPSKLLAVVSGSQGEPMSALARVAVDNHKSLSIERGDTVVLSSRIIPGNEKAIYRMLNHFAKRGAEVIYGSMNPPLHVSGHASAEELKLILNLVRPKYFMPIHGEYRQLAKHAALAEHLRHVGSRGDLHSRKRRHAGARSLRRAQGGARCPWAASASTRGARRHRRRHRDPRPAAPLGRRLHAADHHHRQTHRQGEGLPEIVTRGFISEDGSDLLEKARELVARTIATSTDEERTDWGVMKEKIRSDLRRFLIKQTSRHPLIMPVILEV